MQAVVFKQGQGLCYVEDAPLPDPEPDLVRLKVEACGFCGSDHSLVETGLLPDGTILGHEFVGRLDKVGSAVDLAVWPEVRPGRRFMVRHTFCGKCPACMRGQYSLCTSNRRSTGIGDLPGGFAEYVMCYPSMLIPIPHGLATQSAALAELFASSYHGLRKVQKFIPFGRNALVMGGGPIGLAMVQLLRVAGYSNIILSEPKPDKRELALRTGATHAVDPLSEDLAEVVAGITGSRGVEAFFECSGVMENIGRAVSMAPPASVICLVSLNFTRPEVAIPTLYMNLKEIALLTSMGNTHEENIQCLEWLARGFLEPEPLISHRCTLGELPELYSRVIHPGQSIKVMLVMAENRKD